MFRRAYGKEPELPQEDEWPIYTRVSNPNFIMLDNKLQYIELRGGKREGCLFSQWIIGDFYDCNGLV